MNDLPWMISYLWGSSSAKFSQCLRPKFLNKVGKYLQEDVWLWLSIVLGLVVARVRRDLES